MSAITDETVGTLVEFMERMQAAEGDDGDAMDDKIGSIAAAKHSMSKYVKTSGLPLVGEPFRDCSFVSLDGKRTVSLAALARPGRPLVMNFGSCS